MSPAPSLDLCCQKLAAFERSSKNDRRTRDDDDIENVFRTWALSLEVEGEDMRKLVANLTAKCSIHSSVRIHYLI